MQDRNTPQPRTTHVQSYTEAEHTAYADVDSAERITIEKRTFTPGRVLVHYHWRTQLGHDGWTVGNIEISGLWDGLQFYPGSGRVILSMRDAPAWAQEFAEANMPTSALVFPASRS